ncbi:MAG: hypothetical protein QM214_02945 [Bacillota bacterium]|jgi:metal-responsive CopG/Arc/MetJ family transcriptional regulator|nr:hypothetical protein [Bacillota bacterium]HHU43646.1 hypothetical protein [Clostridiales bacterium]
MKKSLYSLMLMDDVVREIDELARSQNTNRSNMVNQILAEYVSMTTPEKTINNIFNAVADLLNRDIFSAFFEPHSSTLSLKSSLDYKYRPTIKYEVELYRDHNQALGELKVIFRTQSAALLMELNRFFRFWTRLETAYLSHYYPQNSITYNLEEGRFFRTFKMPVGKNYSCDSIANAITSYIEMFDDLLKGYLTGKYPTSNILEKKYVEYLNSGADII